MLEAIVDMQCDCPDPDCTVKDPSPYVVTLMATSERDVELLRRIITVVDGVLSRAPLRHVATMEQLVESKMLMERIFAETDMFRIFGMMRPNQEPPPPPEGDSPFDGLEEIEVPQDLAGKVD